MNLVILSFKIFNKLIKMKFNFLIIIKLKTQAAQKNMIHTIMKQILI